MSHIGELRTYLTEEDAELFYKGGHRTYLTEEKTGQILQRRTQDLYHREEHRI